MKHDLKQYFAQTIIRRMQELKLSCVDVGRMMKVTPAYISQLRAGKNITLETMVKLEKILKFQVVTVDQTELISIGSKLGSVNTKQERKHD